MPQNLFTLIESLRARGVTMIYVTHRMPEVFRLCDRVTVLRDGKCVGTLDRGDATPDAVVRMMIGRSIEAYFPRHLANPPGEVMLSVRNLSSPGKFRDVGFDIRAGEIVGIRRAGRRRAQRNRQGGFRTGCNRPRGRGDGRAQRCGWGTFAKRCGGGSPWFRKTASAQGLVLMMGGRENFSLAMLRRFRRFGVLDKRSERARTREFFQRLRVKTSSLEAPVAAMSGGNQQKVALAKWLGRNARLLIVDEPTRGVDVGAKAAVHALIDDLARQGIGIMLISSELPELLNLSTRVLVMRGRSNGGGTAP